MTASSKPGPLLSSEPKHSAHGERPHEYKPDSDVGKCSRLGGSSGLGNERRRFGLMAATVQDPRQACRCAQFVRQCLLLVRDCDRAAKIVDRLLVAFITPGEQEFGADPQVLGKDQKHGAWCCCWMRRRRMPPWR